MTPKIVPNVLEVPAARVAASVLIVGLAFHAAQAQATEAVSPTAVGYSIVQDKTGAVPLGVMLFVHRPGAVPAPVPVPDMRAKRWQPSGIGDCDRDDA
jgi:hypothetical protein